MNIFSEAEYREIVEANFTSQSIKFREVQRDDRTDTKLSQDLFFDLSRKHHAHIPDMMINECNEWMPVELKSPQELYGAGRSSLAHLCSYFLQTIYGQCLSYADLFRCEDESCSIYLIIPKVITSDIQGFNDIESLFNTVLTADSSMLRNLMNMKSVTFEIPSFAMTTNGQYGLIKASNCIDLLITKITYVISTETSI